MQGAWLRMYRYQPVQETTGTQCAIPHDTWDFSVDSAIVGTALGIVFCVTAALGMSVFVALVRCRAIDLFMVATHAVPTCRGFAAVKVQRLFSLRSDPLLFLYLEPDVMPIVARSRPCLPCLASEFLCFFS